MELRSAMVVIAKFHVFTRISLRLRVRKAVKLAVMFLKMESQITGIKMVT
jgi:hypothetical protein